MSKVENPIEYRTIDKSAWKRGPWDAEPDKMQWYDAATGLPCLIVRHPSSGHLCGYVGVPCGHPWHRHDYDDCAADVHGGLTFASGCQHGDDPSTGVCHVPAPGEPDDVWWLGFDCAHSGDDTSMANHRDRWSDYETYRDVSYVQAECASLASQALLAQREEKL